MLHLDTLPPIRVYQDPTATPWPSPTPSRTSKCLNWVKCRPEAIFFFFFYFSIEWCVTADEFFCQSRVHWRFIFLWRWNNKMTYMNMTNKIWIDRIAMIPPDYQSRTLCWPPWWLPALLPSLLASPPTPQSVLSLSSSLSKWMSTPLQPRKPAAIPDISPSGASTANRNGSLSVLMCIYWPSITCMKM